MTTPVSADDHKAALAAEYGKWVAIEPINIGNVRAFNIGDAVPASHVANDIVPKSAVRGADTKAAQAATEKG